MKQCPTILLHLNMNIQILHTFVFTFPLVLTKEKLLNNQELLELITNSFILMIFIFKSRVIVV